MREKLEGKGARGLRGVVSALRGGATKSNQMRRCRGVAQKGFGSAHEVISCMHSVN